MKALKKLFKKLNMWVWLLLGLLALLGIFLLGPILSRIKVKAAPPVLRERLSKYAQLYGYSDYIVELILAMSALESGRWTSDLYRKYNNPWGMKNPSRRPTTSLGALPALPGIPPGFAHYMNLDTAANDIFLWLEYNNSATYYWNLKDFIVWIQSKGYEPLLTTEEYLKRVKNAIT